MKILLIEDDEHIAKNIKKGLENKAFVVDLALDGEEGYDLAATEKYDAIIIDWMLPKLDGLEICKKLRHNGNTTPVLILSAKTLVGDRVEGLDSGADDYLGKPFAFEELLARINALSRRPQADFISILQVQDLSLDPATYEVKRGQQKISLTRKEFTLLKFFMRHPGQVFTAEQIAERVWGFDSDVLPNTAQVYIGYLRKKIDQPFSQKRPLLKTVNGFGYKIDV